MHSCVVFAEFLSNVRAFLSITHVHTAWTLGAHFTPKGTRLSRQHERNWIALTHFPPPWGHTPRIRISQRPRVDKRQTQVAKRPALNLPSSHDGVVGGSVLVTLLGECALIRGTLPLARLRELIKINS